MNIHPEKLTDGYKLDHRRQYFPGTTKVTTNFTPRKSRIPGVDYVIFFGLQYFVKEYLINLWNANFFKIPKEEIIKRYQRRINNYLGPNNIGIEHIAALHDLGYLPLKVMALPEGSKVPIRIAPLIMWNTKPEFFWVTNYFETILSTSLWEACNSATIAREYRKRFDADAIKTGGSLDFVPFQGHDFSFRGMGFLEAALGSGAGHLLSFAGSDTLPAIDFLEEYYNADSDKELVAVSVAATEHSVMCSYGKEDESEAFSRLIDLYPEGILSVVSDTWDLTKVVKPFKDGLLFQLHDKIVARNGKLVIRPDSCPKGLTPADILCGKNRDIPLSDREKQAYYPDFYYKGVIECLYELFGGTLNSKGYIDLSEKIGAIYGDSISLDVRDDVSARLMAKGFTSTNWVAGIGSYTYQYNTRDTQGWAAKATHIEVLEDGKTVGRDIFKDPITDDGTKKSAKGLIAVYEQDDTFVMKDQVSWKEVENCAYKTVFEDGKLISDQALSEIRQRVLNS